jgi:hypothetical protein
VLKKTKREKLKQVILDGQGNIEIEATTSGFKAAKEDKNYYKKSRKSILSTEYFQMHGKLAIFITFDNQLILLQTK